MLRRTKHFVEDREGQDLRRQAVPRSTRNNCADTVRTNVFNPPATARFHCPTISRICTDNKITPSCLTSRESNNKLTKINLQLTDTIVSPRHLPYNRINRRVLDGTFCSSVGPSTRYFWKKGQAQDKPLGSGYTSTVYRGVDIDTGDPVAIKLVPKKKQRLLSSEAYYRRLYQWLPLHPNPNILRLRDFFEDSQNFYIVSDLYTGPDLVDYVLSFAPQSIPTKCVKRITIQLLFGLYHLHSSGLLHRDLKLDNIIFANESRQNLVIVDFDMSYFFISTHNLEQPYSVSFDELTIVGTKDYMAPENYRGMYSEASDLWSLGVILYILLDGHFPFDLSYASSPREIRDVLKQGIKFAPELTEKHPQATDLVQRLLVYEPQNRIRSVEEVLMHPWFESEHIFIRKMFWKFKMTPEKSQSIVQRDKLMHHSHGKGNITSRDYSLFQLTKQNIGNLPSCFPQLKKFTKKNITNDSGCDKTSQKDKGCQPSWENIKKLSFSLEKISSISTMSTTTDYCAPFLKESTPASKYSIKLNNSSKRFDNSKAYENVWSQSHRMHNSLLNTDMQKNHKLLSESTNLQYNTLLTYRRNF